MRVQEVELSISYNMGKNRKHRIRKSKENEADESSEDGLGGCPHVTKAINLAALRKVVTKSTVTLGECTSCSKEAPNTTSRDLFGGVIEGPVAATETDDTDTPATTVCICLQCGHQGCDRNSLNKHALKHYKTPHTGIHCITVNLSTWVIWCYICDDQVQASGRVQPCIDYLQKQCGVTKPEFQSPVRPLDSPVGEAVPLPVNTLAAKNVTPTSCMKVKGLNNLGNTCFFNAVMQIICQTRGLESLLLDRTKAGRVCTIPGPELGLDTESSSSDEDEHQEDPADKLKAMPSIQTVFGDPGAVTLALLNFVQEMKGGTTKNGTVNPTALFTQVCKKAPRFKGSQQQDSHELLRYLIDSIRTEEIKRGQISILKYFQLSETTSPKKVDEETKIRVKGYGRQVKHTFVDSLFGGQLVSTVKCEECKSVSQICEAFLDLSLPVMEEKPQRPNLILIGKKKDSFCGGDGDEVDTYSAEGNLGLDACHEKPSKYQERKNKKLAKKEAKKKTKVQKSKSVEHHESAEKESNEHLFEGTTAKVCGDVEETEGSRSEELRLETESRAEANTSPLTVDSSPEGSKDSIDANEDEDDPSDADIEDNIDCETQNHGDPLTSDLKTHQCSADIQTELLNNKDTVTRPTVTDSGGETVILTADFNSNKQFISHEILTPSMDSGGNYQCSCIVELSQQNSMRMSSADVQMNMPDSLGNGHLTSSNDAKISVNCLCGKVEDLHLSSINGVDGSSISCEVSIANSQVIELSNGVGRLTVKDSDQEVHDKQKTSSEVSASPGEPSQHKSNPDSQSQVSATFSLSLSAEHPNGVTEVCSSAEVKEQDGLLIKCEEKHQVQLNILKTQHEYFKEAKSYSMNTLAPRYHPSSKECSILSCLNQFTAAELLTGSNKFGCKECTRRKRKNSLFHPSKGDKKVKDTVYSNANKQYLIFRPPAVLTLHLKRFEQTGLTSRKVNHHVDFPLVLDLAPYCSSLCLGVREGQTKVLYSLYGVVEHSGRLTGGHYTAYIKVRTGLGPTTQFLHINPPRPLDLLNIYLARVVKSKEHIHFEKMDNCTVDKEEEAEAEKLAPPGRWFHISDSRVNEVAEAEVLRAQAYLLFYERIY
uniref:ubiquitinyl hydrolase 1 n=1 Tax=Biomphalaria glabrata TaxID=6526 RepID=A0A2C9LRS2_BIOGL